ncbi:ceramide-1-phosphate transfer protein [Arctopsyche grandis]|uniref:ceramide-1-phosphate transfer protein n=1 Tax=Arctopsyche grandis TaxID=121162 RepID=UPI00406DA4D9
MVSSEGMAQNNHLDLVYVNEVFTESLHNVDDININKYIEGYKELMKFLNLIGSVFSFVSSDVKSKIKIMEKHAVGEESRHYETFRKMMHFEKDTGLHEKIDFVSGSRTMLRLHRGLDFIRLFLKELGSGDEASNTCTVCQKAYSDSLAEYHPWYIRQAAMLAMHALPSKKDLLLKIFGSEEALKQALSALTDTLKTCDEVYFRVETSYTDFEFHGLP